MKYTEEERLNIGRRIYTGETDKYTAAEEYQISIYTARDYMRQYRRKNGLPDRRTSGRRGAPPTVKSVETSPTLEEFESMSKEELILELMRSRIRETRLKNGYEVRGDGANKEYVLLDIESTR